MADTKVSALIALTGANVASNDLFPVVDTDATTTKSITASELVNYINGVGVLFDVETVASTNASYVPNSTFQVIIIDDAGDDTDIDITFASSLSTGSVVVIYAADGGALEHNVVLGGSQTWDGTNTTAIFDTAEDYLVAVALSATRVLVFANSNVTFSA